MRTDAKAVQLAQARAKGRMLAENASMTTQETLERLKPEHRAEVANRLAQMPRKCRPAYLRAMNGKSRTAAIRPFCAECMGSEGLPDSVRSCTAPACPLFPYRPGGGL